MNNKDNLYEVLKTILIATIMVAAMAYFLLSCSQIHAVIPDDWPLEEQIEEDTVNQDTINQDTITQDTPCIPQLYDQPMFVSGYWYIPFTIISDSITVCAWPYCRTVATGTDVTLILLDLLDQFNPAYQYEVYVNNDHRQTVVYIAIGANNKQEFNGKVWVRPHTVHSGWGFEPNVQSFFFFDALTFEEFIDVIDAYPSVDKFTFQYTNWDSLQYIEAFDKLLDCRIGRSYADLRYLPFVFPDSVYEKFENAGWDTVLH
jgi:hypothetical protein